MAILETARIAPARGAASIGADASWRELYRVGGIAALLSTLIYVVAVVVNFAVPPAPTSGGAAILEYIAANRLVYMLEQVLWLLPSVLLILVFLALYPALKHIDKSYAAIGTVLGIFSWALTLVYPATGGGAPALVYLSDRYVVASGAVERAAYVAAAETFIAQNVIPTAVGILEPIGILIVSLVMLRGAYGRGLVYLGILTGGLGIVSEALRPLLGAGYMAYGLLLFAWFVAVGWQLYRLGVGPRAAQER
jgi:hypothetical protein